MNNTGTVTNTVDKVCQFFSDVHFIAKATRVVVPIVVLTAEILPVIHPSLLSLKNIVQSVRHLNTIFEVIRYPIIVMNDFKRNFKEGLLWRAVRIHQYACYLLGIASSVVEMGMSVTKLGLEQIAAGIGNTSVLGLLSRGIGCLSIISSSLFILVHASGIVLRARAIYMCNKKIKINEEKRRGWENLNFDDEDKKKLITTATKYAEKIGSNLWKQDDLKSSLKKIEDDSKQSTKKIEELKNILGHNSLRSFKGVGTSLQTRWSLLREKIHHAKINYECRALTLQEEQVSKKILTHHRYLISFSDKENFDRLRKHKIDKLEIKNKNVRQNRLHEVFNLIYHIGMGTLATLSLAFAASGIGSIGTVITLSLTAFTVGAFGVFNHVWQAEHPPQPMPQFE